VYKPVFDACSNVKMCRLPGTITRTSQTEKRFQRRNWASGIKRRRGVAQTPLSEKNTGMLLGSRKESRNTKDGKK